MKLINCDADKVHELRNLVDDDRNLDIGFVFNPIDETRGKTVRKDISPPLQSLLKEATNYSYIACP